MRRTIPFAPARMAAAAIADVIHRRAASHPSRWAGRIAPRKFVMVSATADERMPHAQVEELFQSAREPKEEIHMSGGHVHGDSATITRLVHIVMSRVRAPAGSAFVQSPTI